MSKNIFLTIVLLILIFPFVYSSGSIQTGSLNPQSINLCGENVQYVTITANNIYNKENIELTSVSARLYLSGNAGLSYITSQQVNLGDIAPLSLSSILPSWTLQCNSPISGTYLIYVNYSSSNGYTASSYGEAVSTIIVQDAIVFSGNISLLETNNSQTTLQNVQLISDNTPTIQVTTTRNSICKGTLDLDESYSDMDFIFYGLEKNHNYTFVNQLTEGQHSVYVRCKDELDNIMQTPLVITFQIDSVSPQIAIISPGSKVSGDFTDLIINVNEDSECRYSYKDIAFDSMNNFEIINGTLFKEHLDELDEETYDYYIKCKDKVGNIASKKITFDVGIPPTAEIILEKSSPLTKGTYELTLIPSKKLKSIPSLSYTFTDDNSFSREIGLVKENNNYKGYLIVEESEKTRQGVFSFKGEDLEGNEGIEIKTGSFFLVDTVKPNAPDSLQATSVDEGVLLRWYYEGEKPDQFNIYRSTLQGVGPIFYYDSITYSGFEYLDKNVVNGQVYYYRVAALDMAGNIGALSNEVSVYTTSGSNLGISTEVIINKNPPTLQTREWKITTEKSIDSLLIDLEWALNNLKEQATKEKAVEDLALIKQVIETKESIDKLKAQLKGVDLVTISDSDLREQLSRADAQVARTKKLTPQSLKLEKTTAQLQAITLSDIELAITETITGQNYSENQLKNYINQMEKINNNLKTEMEIKTLSIEYLDDSTEKKVLVTKSFSYESPDSLKDILIIEIIPKTVAGDVSSIDVRTPGYNVIKADPILSWRYPELSFDKQSFTYLLLSNDNSESAKTTKTIALLDPIKIINQDKTLLTGFSIFISNVTRNGLEIFGIILGVIVIISLAMYYLVVINEVDLNPYMEKLPILKNIKYPFKKRSSEQKQESIRTSSQEITRQKNNINLGELEKINTNIQQQSPLSDFENFNYLFQTDNIIKTPPTQYFYVKNGDIIRGITEMKIVLEKMDDFTFYYHANDNKNDFAEWIEAIYHNKNLADLIASAKTKEQLIMLMEEISKNN